MLLAKQTNEPKTSSVLRFPRQKELLLRLELQLHLLQLKLQLQLQLKLTNRVPKKTTKKGNWTKLLMNLKQEAREFRTAINTFIFNLKNDQQTERCFKNYIHIIFRH